MMTWLLGGLFESQNISFHMFCLDKLVLLPFVGTHKIDRSFVMCEGGLVGNVRFSKIILCHTFFVTYCFWFAIRLNVHFIVKLLFIYRQNHTLCPSLHVFIKSLMFPHATATIVV